MKKFVLTMISSTFLSGFLGAHAALAAQALPSADSLLSGWRNAIYTDHEHSKMQLSLIDPKSTPIVRDAEIYYKGKSGQDSRILMRFTSPSSIRGMAFLSIRSPGEAGADQWLYLPAYKKSRRLSSHSRDESFLDSDFSNGDISFEYENAFDFKVIGEKKLMNQDVYVVEGIVKPSKREGLNYSKEILYFTKSEKLNLLAEFYDRGNQPVKSLKVSNWKRYGKRWAADKIEIENLRTKHRSILKFSERDTNNTPADRIFTIGELESGR